NVHTRAKELGLSRSDEFLAAQRARAAHHVKTDPVMAERTFRPGHQTWNAGMKGFKAGGRSAETRFKPGSKPVTTLPLGSHRIL
ncbi:hypothetical protein OEK97_28380, partial [Escherichia coli]|uniref:hypothetical protein n=1 Tax=Escherichia coli TaxID=562 RepID=UPI0021D8BD0A